MKEGYVMRNELLIEITRLKIMTKQGYREDVTLGLKERIKVLSELYVKTYNKEVPKLSWE